MIIILYRATLLLLNFVALHTCTVCSLLSNIVTVEVCDATGDEKELLKPG